MALKAMGESLERLCAEAKNHLGMHYVGSFNDLNSGAADDLEERIKEEKVQSKRSASVGPEQKFVGGKSKQADLHSVNRSLGGKRADWNYDLSTPSHSPDSLNDIFFQAQEREKEKEAKFPFCLQK
jgi:hypothetical protein